MKQNIWKMHFEIFFETTKKKVLVIQFINIIKFSKTYPYYILTWKYSHKGGSRLFDCFTQTDIKAKLRAPGRH